MKTYLIAGVRYTPQWDWTPAYRNDFAAPAVYIIGRLVWHIAEVLP